MKTKIRVGSVVKEKVEEMEEKKRKGRRSIMKKELVGCLQDVSGGGS